MRQRYNPRIPPHKPQRHLRLSLSYHIMHHNQRLKHRLPTHQPSRPGSENELLTVHTLSLSLIFNARNTSAMPASPACVAINICSTYFAFGAAHLCFVAPYRLSATPPFPPSLTTLRTGAHLNRLLKRRRHRVFNVPSSPSSVVYLSAHSSFAVNHNAPVRLAERGSKLADDFGSRWWWWRGAAGATVRQGG